MKTRKSCQHCLIMLFVAVLAATLLGGCQPTTTGIPSTKLAPTVNTSAVEADRTGTTGSASPDGESPDAVLSSLKKVDDYPFYTMHYAGAYHEANTRWKIDPPGLQSRKEKAGNAVLERRRTKTRRSQNATVNFWYHGAHPACRPARLRCPIGLSPLWN